MDGGCMNLALDELLVDESRRTFLLAVAERVLPSASLDAGRTGELSVVLVKGDLKSIDSSPIDYY